VTESTKLVTTVRRASLNRLVVGIAGVALTTALGSAGVLAAYYPLRHAGYGLQWLLVMALMTAESAAVHLPSEVILPVGGWLVVRDHHLGVAGVLALSAVAALGNLIGSSLLYAAGRHGGRPLVRRFGRYFLLSEHDLDLAAARMGRRHLGALFLSRVLPVVRTYGGFVAGMMRLPLVPFLALTYAGSFVWAIAFVALGAALGADWSAVRGPMEVAGGAVVALIVVALLALTLRGLRPATAD
jgi:membrane protein DedA with SNARE-associated domain